MYHHQCHSQLHHNFVHSFHHCHRCRKLESTFGICSHYGHLSSSCTTITINVIVIIIATVINIILFIIFTILILSAHLSRIPFSPIIWSPKLSLQYLPSYFPKRNSLENHCSLFPSKTPHNRFEIPPVLRDFQQIFVSSSMYQKEFLPPLPEFVMITQKSMVFSLPSSS